MRNLYFVLFLLIVVVGCGEYTYVEKLDLIANNLKKIPARTFNGCLVRYSLTDYYTKLNESIQRRAIDNAFAIWQKANPNMMYVSSTDPGRTEIAIRFINHDLIGGEGEVADFGILQTTLKPISRLKQIAGTRYELLLDDSFNWDENAIMRVVGYQIGSYLGFPTSSETASVMYSLSSAPITKLSKEDSLTYIQLYPLPCKDLAISFLPISLELSSLTTKDIKLEKAGTVVINSTGIMNVGTFIGDSTPDGKFQFVYLGVTFNVDPVYNIEATYPHAAVMYKLNNEQKWRLCKSNCEFSTNGNEYITLTLHINDKDVTDNIGSYDVVIDYK